MTLTHTANLETALQAAASIRQWWTVQQFDVSEIYLAIRRGDNGQYERLVTIGLGRNNNAGKTATTVVVHDPPSRFPHMPLTELEWVREERMQLKRRRRGKGSGKNRQGRQRQGRSQRVRDSPEVIAAKQAARKLKRQALEAAAAESNKDSGVSE